MSAMHNRLRALGDRVVGTGQPVYVTGEIGINHNGDLDNAIALIDVAAESGLTDESADGALLAAAGVLTILFRYLTDRRPIDRPRLRSDRRRPRPGAEE